MKFAFTAPKMRAEFTFATVVIAAATAALAINRAVAKK
jgi:hypothetical protein